METASLLKVCLMSVHLYNGSPEVCFIAVNFTEERDFDFLKICYFVDGCTFRHLFLGETNSLKMSSVVLVLILSVTCTFYIWCLGIAFSVSSLVSSGWEEWLSVILIDGLY